MLAQMLAIYNIESIFTTQYVFRYILVFSCPIQYIESDLYSGVKIFLYWKIVVEFMTRKYETRMQRIAIGRCMKLTGKKAVFRSQVI